MRVLPVIDLKRGQVVRGVAGRRETYRPIQSCLCGTPAPHDVARAFAKRLNRDEVYVADLDAIDGAPPDRVSLSEIAASGMRLWVDAGMQSARDTERLGLRRLESTERVIDRLIVGMESVAGPPDVAAMVDLVGPERLVFSLDLKSGRPLARWPDWQTAEPIDIARQIREIGVCRMIVLDLAQVGTGRGVNTLPLCRQLKSDLPDVEVVTGGGIAACDDLVAPAQAGVDAVLVASALHDGSIGRAEMEQVEAQ